MDTAALFVTVVGLGLAALVLWYFFFSARPAAAVAALLGGVQVVDIVVKGGYTPAEIVVKRGQPVPLNFYRDEENSCSEELLLPAFHLRRELPAFQTTRVELLPQQAGRFGFTCGMVMLRGTLVVT